MLVNTRVEWFGRLLVPFGRTERIVMNGKWLLIALVSLGLAATSAYAKSEKGDKQDQQNTPQSTSVKRTKQDVKKTEAKADAGQEDEETVSIKQVPTRVRKTLQREAGDAKIQTVDVEETDGRTIYEADVEIDGLNYEIKVDAKGRLISKMLDMEEAAPAAIKVDVKIEKRVEKKGDQPAKSEKVAKGDNKPEKQVQKTAVSEKVAKGETKVDKSQKNAKVTKADQQQEEKKSAKKQKQGKEEDEDDDEDDD